METPALNPIAPRPKKKLHRRALSDHSQRIRHTVQWIFLALNAWIGIQFLLWVLSLEHPSSWSVPRPSGVEGWLPIAGLMNAKYLFVTGRIPAIHPAAMFLFLIFVAISLLFKKAFCAWLCPIGTLSENLWKLGRRIFRRNLQLPKWADIPLRGLKYLLLAFFAFIIGTMSAEALEDFMTSPYGIIADVRMLNFFRDISVTGAVIVSLLVLLSMLIQNFWCRYLCPYGALLGLVSILSPVKIRRDTEACIDCAKCARACPMQLPVDKLVQIRSAECSACLLCVTACPADNALQFALPPHAAETAAERWYRRALPPARIAFVLAILFFAVVFYAKATHHWQSEIPQHVYAHLVPRANETNHPGP